MPESEQSVVDRFAVPTPAVFLDRDGVIIKEAEYLNSPGQIEIIPGSIEAIGELSAFGYAIVIITNQSGVARGMFSEEDVHLVHRALLELLANEMAPVNAVYYCPHHPEGSYAEYAQVCDCRKPAPGMLLRARDDLNLDLERSWLVGDKVSDVDAAKAAGVRPILVQTGYGEASAKKVGADIPVHANLKAAADWIRTQT